MNWLVGGIVSSKSLNQLQNKLDIFMLNEKKYEAITPYIFKGELNLFTSTSWGHVLDIDKFSGRHWFRVVGYIGIRFQKDVNPLFGHILDLGSFIVLLNFKITCCIVHLVTKFGISF